jgi:ATP-binding protein involved in chromosome partitioning
MSDRTVPSTIEQAGPRALRIVWGDGVAHLYDVAELRRQCRCAVCVDEWSGKRLLDPKSIPEDVRPREIRPVGHYAIHIDWSDGHSTGIYTFDFLRRIGDEG